MIKEKIKNYLNDKIPDAEILIETKSDLPEENIEDMIKNIVLKEPNVKDIHNISVNNIKDELNITLHIELKKDIKLSQAEIITKNIENKVKTILDNI